MSKIGLIYGNSFFHFGFQPVYDCRVFFVICIKPMNYFVRQVIATDKIFFFKFCVFCFIKVSVVDLITLSEFMPRNIIKPTAFYTHFLSKLFPFFCLPKLPLCLLYFVHFSILPFGSAFTTAFFTIGFSLSGTKHIPIYSFR